jgi:hypothetical protein
MEIKGRVGWYSTSLILDRDWSDRHSSLRYSGWTNQNRQTKEAAARALSVIRKAEL